MKKKESNFVARVKNKLCNRFISHEMQVKSFSFAYNFHNNKSDRNKKMRSCSCCCDKQALKRTAGNEISPALILIIILFIMQPQHFTAE